MVVAASAAACGDDSGSGSGGGSAGACYDYGSFTGDSPAVSFATDVAPILQQSCGLSTSCHGTKNGPADRPYLGSDGAQVLTENVGKDAQKEPGMKRIAPSDPAHSFMMHKIDGTFDCEALTCGADSSCGTKMPQGGALAAAQADTIRRWIAQGAENN
jgi:hypothetical protein